MEMPPLNPTKYARYLRLVARVQHRLGLRLEVRGHPDAMNAGDIFLFNHFTRFETAVPPHLIFQKTGAIARSVADASLFKVHPKFSEFLNDGGAVPTDLPHLLPFLAAEIMRGRKAVIFPEGGMVKDKQVFDLHGDYAVFSEKNQSWRKPYKGAFVLAQMLEVFKSHIRTLAAAKEKEHLNEWATRLEITVEDLLARSAKTTLIVPGNLTFFPLRNQPGLFAKTLLAAVPGMGTRARDELVVETNLLFKHTQLTVNFGTPIPVRALPAQLLKIAQKRLAAAADLPAIFALAEESTGRITKSQQQVLGWLNAEVARLRGLTMNAIYRGATINLHHLAATAINVLQAAEQWQLPAQTFHRLLYLSLKSLQRQARHDPALSLHASLTDATTYSGLLTGAMPALMEFLATARSVVRKPDDRHGTYRFSHALEDILDAQEVRLINPLRVYANEVAPLPQVALAVREALRRLALPEEVQQARLTAELWDDLQQLPSDQATPNAAPFLLRPAGAARQKAPLGVLLLHGFTSVPGQMRPLADELVRQGYPVLAPRLPGHGTRPHDLLAADRHTWQANVTAALQVLGAHAEKVVIVGYSLGGLLALRQAAETKQPVPLAGIVTLAAPLEVAMRAMRYLPVAVWLNRFGRALAHLPGLKGLRHGLLRFYPTVSDQPDLNYNMLPIAGIIALDDLARRVAGLLPTITVPALVVHGTTDDTAAPSSAHQLYKQLGSAEKRLHWLPNATHGLLIPGSATATLTIQAVIEFLQSLSLTPAGRTVLQEITARRRLPVDIVEQPVSQPAILGPVF